MPFFCCCRSKKRESVTQPEIYINKEEELRKTEEELVAKNAEIVTLKKRIENLENDLSNTKEKLEKSENEAEERQQLIAVKDKDITELKEKFDTLQEEFDTQKRLAKQKETEWKDTSEKKTKRIQDMEKKMLDVMQNNQKQSQKPGVKERRDGVGGTKVVKALNAEKQKKDIEEKKFLMNVISKNDLLRHLLQRQIEEMVDYLRPKSFPQNHTLIKEGTEGDRLYILQSGRCEVTQQGDRLKVMEGGELFGELAILYNCKRTATIKALEPVKVWYMERVVYQYIMMNDVKTHISELRKLVKNTPLSKLGEKRFAKITSAVVEQEFEKGEFIVRQGEIGRTFFIIKEGEVDVTEVKNGSQDMHGTWIRTLEKGIYFGEKALRREGDKRTANIVAKSGKVVCYTLDQRSFKKLIGDAANMLWEEPGRLLSVNSRDSLDAHRNSSISVDFKSSPRNSYQISPKKSFENVALENFNYIATLGSGGFGKVELVKLHDRDESYALKCMKKVHIVATKQEEHVHSEKKIMLECNCQFIVQLYKTFKNDRYVYMLMEACLGGELWTRLRDEGMFSERRAKFYTACVIEALDYLHRRGIIYRDLKPENLLLDARGYVKLVDFGFAKKIQSGEKTWTFCGTPEYVAPEIILNQGHDFSSDYWALGVLIFEFLTGNPPFNSANPMKTYRMALRGIEALDWPLSVKKIPQNLIRRLCKEKPSERIGNLRGGMNDIRDHKWFMGFDWQGLRRGNLLVEYIPVISSISDTRNFDKFEKTNESVLAETSGWDENF